MTNLSFSLPAHFSIDEKLVIRALLASTSVDDWNNNRDWAIEALGLDWVVTHVDRITGLGNGSDSHENVPSSLPLIKFSAFVRDRGSLRSPLRQPHSVHHLNS